MLRKKKVRSLLLVAVLLSGLFATFHHRDMTYAEEGEPQPAPAQLQISPGTEKVTITADTIIDKTLNVSNIGTTDAEFKVYATPYSALNADGDIDFEAENKYSQLAKWIKIKDESGNYVEETTYRLPAGESKAIEYRITPPPAEDIPDGSQHATIFVESIGRTVSADGIETISRIGLVISGAGYGKTVEQTEINNFHMDSFLFSGNITNSVSVKNTGNVDSDAYLKVTIKNLFGKTVFEDRKATYVLPETERKFELAWEETPWVGIFNVSAEVGTSSAQDSRSGVVLVLPIFIIVVQIILLTAIVVWAIFIIKRKRAQKTKKKHLQTKLN